MSTAIWWIRRDLRLVDNQALTLTSSMAEQVIPVFVLDPRLLSSPYAGDQRIAFLFAGLRALDNDLRRLGSRLIVRRGQPTDVLAALCQESGAAAVVAEEDFSPYAVQRDARVGEVLPLYLTGGLTVFPPEMIRKKDGLPYTVFTPFSKVWKALPRPESADLLPVPSILSTSKDLFSELIPDVPSLSEGVPFRAGGAEALRRLEQFTSGEDPAVFHYAELRNRPDLDGTSVLSPYLRMGMLSLRQAVVAAREAAARAADQPGRQGAETWLNELIWREFYLSILAHFPHVRRRSFRPKYDAVQWDNDPRAFDAWCRGQTGYPIVDAAMRQLTHSSWMHNRTRMISASFLVKDLLIDWRWGERWFMQQLVDGDPAANNGGWQWTAGTGTDAAPYFRIFNPISQSKKFDPDGRYIRRWLPELAVVPDEYIHEPWRMPEELQAEIGCQIGQAYPLPIVDHAAARKRTLAAYKQAAQ